MLFWIFYGFGLAWYSADRGPRGIDLKTVLTEEIAIGGLSEFLAIFFIFYSILYFFASSFVSF